MNLQTKCTVEALKDHEWEGEWQLYLFSKSCHIYLTPLEEQTEKHLDSHTDKLTH